MRPLPVLLSLAMLFSVTACDGLWGNSYSNCRSLGKHEPGSESLQQCLARMDEWRRQEENRSGGSDREEKAEKPGTRHW